MAASTATPPPAPDPSLTNAQRTQLKKAKARVYSMRARRRQERYVAELRASVDVLMVYRYLVEDCGTDLVLCLTPDAESRVLYANSLALRALGTADATVDAELVASVVGR